jgi:hypothetical protein
MRVLSSPAGMFDSREQLTAPPAPSLPLPFLISPLAGMFRMIDKDDSQQISIAELTDVLIGALPEA